MFTSATGMNGLGSSLAWSKEYADTALIDKSTDTVLRMPSREAGPEANGRCGLRLSDSRDARDLRAIVCPAYTRKFSGSAFFSALELALLHSGKRMAKGERPNCRAVKITQLLYCCTALRLPLFLTYTYYLTVLRRLHTSRQWVAYDSLTLVAAVLYVLLCKPCLTPRACPDLSPRPSQRASRAGPRTSSSTHTRRLPSPRSCGQM